ncbi:Holliday junction branch migration DNA helicase RuvB, partial [Bacillus vallismortis]|nr:Holliday junction branch migration DNA helicase RuvB [Bacillus vallismortis]
LGMLEKFNGGPVCIDNISATIGEEPHSIEVVFEPYLLQIGFIQRTPRGSIVTPAVYHHFQKDAPRYD